MYNIDSCFFVLEDSRINFWLADGALWIACNGMEARIANFPVDNFYVLAELSLSHEECINDKVNGLEIEISDLDVDSRNVCFWQDKLFCDVNMETDDIMALAKFIRSEAIRDYVDNQKMDSNGK